MDAKILIVDDSRTVRAVLKRTIQLAGFDASGVREAGNGLEALTALEADGADVVLTDIHMPEMNGVELVQALRANPKFAEQAIVVISSESTEERRAQLLGLGVKHMLSKPFTAESIRSVIVDMMKVQPS
ncbi:MAG: response regulator [Planctomycetaceae bacterium]|nr:response regulator [Planctomycetaceae bacterium]